MKHLPKLAGILVILLGMQSSYADPITGSFGSHVAAWQTSVKEVCSDVCRRHGGVAEHVKLSSASNQDIYVCRVFTRAVNGFGENSSDNCLFYDSSAGQPKKETKFQCLCVNR